MSNDLEGGFLFFFDHERIGESAGRSDYGAYVYEQLLPLFTDELGNSESYVFFDGDFIPKGKVRLASSHPADRECHERLMRTKRSDRDFQGRPVKVYESCYVVAIHGYGRIDFGRIDGQIRKTNVAGYQGVIRRGSVTLSNFRELCETLSLPMACRIKDGWFEPVNFGFISESELQRMGFRIEGHPAKKERSKKVRKKKPWPDELVYDSLYSNTQFNQVAVGQPQESMETSVPVAVAGRISEILSRYEDHESLGRVFQQLSWEFGDGIVEVAAEKKDATIRLPRAAWLFTASFLEKAFSETPFSASKLLQAAREFRDVANSSRPEEGTALCHFCDQNASEESAAYRRQMPKPIVLVPRCARCKNEHYRVRHYGQLGCLGGLLAGSFGFVGDFWTGMGASLVIGFLGTLAGATATRFVLGKTKPEAHSLKFVPTNEEPIASGKLIWRSCLQCGAEDGWNGHFCSSCGYTSIELDPWTGQVRCPRCRFSFGWNGHYCRHCGFKSTQSPRMALCGQCGMPLTNASVRISDRLTVEEIFGLISPAIAFHRTYCVACDQSWCALCCAKAGAKRGMMTLVCPHCTKKVQLR